MGKNFKSDRSHGPIFFFITKVYCNQGPSSNGNSSFYLLFHSRLCFLFEVRHQNSHDRHHQFAILPLFVLIVLVLHLLIHQPLLRRHNNHRLLNFYSCCGTCIKIGIQRQFSLIYPHVILCNVDINHNYYLLSMSPVLHLDVTLGIHTLLHKLPPLKETI